MSKRNLLINCLGTVSIVLLTMMMLGIRPKQLQNTLSYATRPLWDKPDRPTNVIPHYYAEGMDPTTLCPLHGWTAIPNTTAPEDKPKIYDAIIFSIELDLLEIRLRELYNVVDKFLILESTTTFTGLPKSLLLHENQHRFSFAADKILYAKHEGRPLSQGESPFAIENELRTAMNTLISSASPRPNKDYILMSDVDELPSSHTLSLFTSCTNTPPSIHLQLRTYIYSFEFHLDTSSSWRPQLHIYTPQTYYRHSKATETILADAGWHCTFCFRRLHDFAFKARAYSHTDRLQGMEGVLLDKGRMQKVICEGRDFFGMLPEAFDFRELVSKMGSVPKTGSAVGLPRYLLENAERFRFLLPGGCVREE
ncbi:hypothetical protein HDV00_005118 [Rhizophlyctis rosea]|nr:hypothetical protein HDV00_005118 [Rhizophlyctis rosea]